MAVFCSLYSSSSGNCTYIGTSSGGVLIDAGVSAKRITEALADIGVSPSDIAAVFITHEHSDHINGVRVFASKNRIKVYATAGTLDGMDDYGVFKSAVNAYVIPEEGMETAGMFVKPFRTSHDCNEPCGYTVITPEGKKASVATDTGCITEEIRRSISGSDIVLLESNHDVGMLQNGPYPYPLKQRILSDFGHLSNEICSEAACDLVAGGTSKLILGHLSKENNIPSLAYQTTKSALDIMGAKENEDYILKVAADLNDPVIF